MAANGEKQKKQRFAATAVFFAVLVIEATANAAEDSPFASRDSQLRIATYRLEIKIDAPPEFVYPYLIEEDKISRWQLDHGVTVTFPRGVEPRIGKQIRVAVEAPTDPWILMEIARLEPGHEVLTRFVGGVLEGEFAYLLQPAQTRGTLLIHEMRIRPVGMLTTFVWEIYGKHMHRAKMRTFLDKIKEIVEADWKAAVP
jgi:uncharacterized protein YndB with AHSA1/START domain